MMPISKERDVTISIRFPLRQRAQVCLSEWVNIIEW